MKLKIFTLALSLSALWGCADPTEEPLVPTISAKWQALTTYMGMSVPLTDAAAYQAALALSPSSASPAAGGATYTAIQTGIQTEAVSNFWTTQCHSVVGMRELTTTVTSSGVATTAPGKVYVMRYKLRLATGAEDPTVRAALVTVPDAATADSAVVAMYAHTGDSGLSYAEIAGAISNLQSTHIVAAPAYPGEPICSTPVTTPGVRDCGGATNTIVAAQGTASVYDGDARDMLGLHACMSAGLTSALSGGTVPSLAADFTTVEATIGHPYLNSDATIKPSFHAANTATSGIKTIYVGSGRGGRVALLAGALSGILIGDTAATTSNITAAVTAFNTANSTSLSFVPHAISGIATLSAGVTNVVGVDRLALRHAISGTLTRTPYQAIPGMLDYQTAMASYLDGTITTEAAAIQVAKRDMVYMTPFLAVSVQNWSKFITSGRTTPGKGSILIMHGTKDKVANISNLSAMYAALNATIAVQETAGSSLSSTPGFEYMGLAYQPTSDYTETCASGVGMCLKAGDFGHSLVPSVVTGRMVNLSEDEADAAMGADSTTLEGTVSTIAAAINGVADATTLTSAQKLPVRAFLLYDAKVNAETTAVRGVSVTASTRQSEKSYRLPAVTPPVTIGIWRSILSTRALSATSVN